MPMTDSHLLLISRDDILRAIQQDQADPLFRQLAALTRHGHHLLATASQPDQWDGEHGSPDDALLGPESIRKRLSDAGGTLDGVYYVRRSLLTQKRIRHDALNDILNRYGVTADACSLFSSNRKFIQAAREIGIHVKQLSRKAESLLDALDNLAEQAE